MRLADGHYETVRKNGSLFSNDSVVDWFYCWIGSVSCHCDYLHDVLGTHWRILHMAPTCTVRSCSGCSKILENGLFFVGGIWGVSSTVQSHSKMKHLFDYLVFLFFNKNVGLMWNSIVFSEFICLESELPIGKSTYGSAASVLYRWKENSKIMPTGIKFKPYIR